MITLLVSLIVFILVVAVLYWIITLLPIRQPFKNIVLALVLLIILILFLYQIPAVNLRLQ